MGSEWEWDGPEQNIKKGDVYEIKLASDDPTDMPIRWDKYQDADEVDDGDQHYYCITGPFNEWGDDRMEDGPIKGMHTITLEFPESGELEFRFLRDGDENAVVFPAAEKCEYTGAKIRGPELSRNERKLEKTTWVVKGEPSALVKID